VRRLIEPDELQPILCEEPRDRGKREAVLLYVEEKVAKIARRIKIGEQHDVAKRAIGRKLLERLATAANVAGARFVSLFGDKPLGSDDVFACARTIKTDIHQSVRCKYLEELAPTGERIGKMVQHAGRIDHVKATVELSDLDNVCLAAFDIL